MFDAKDYIAGIAILSTTIVSVAGWLASAAKDRNQHIFKERFDGRIAMLKQIINVIKPLLDDKPNDPAEIIEKINNSRAEMSIYGYKKEIQLYEGTLELIHLHDYEKAIMDMRYVITSFQKTLRKELKLPIETDYSILRDPKA